MNFRTNRRDYGPAGTIISGFPVFEPESHFIKRNPGNALPDNFLAAPIFHLPGSVRYTDHILPVNGNYCFSPESFYAFCCTAKTIDETAGSVLNYSTRSSFCAMNFFKTISVSVFNRPFFVQSPFSTETERENVKVKWT